VTGPTTSGVRPWLLILQLLIKIDLYHIEFKYYLFVKKYRFEVRRKAPRIGPLTLPAT
jgi:hypothetical protein